MRGVCKLILLDFGYLTLGVLWLFDLVNSNHFIHFTFTTEARTSLKSGKMIS